MLQARRVQAAGAELERPVLAASRQPAAWSFCRRLRPRVHQPQPRQLPHPGQEHNLGGVGGVGRRRQAGDKEPSCH